MFYWSLQLIFKAKLNSQSPESGRSNMAAREPFWKWHRWKSISSYTQVMCCWSLELIFKTKLKLESGNHKIQYGYQVAILKVTSLKINNFLSIATDDMHMKFGIEIQKWNQVTLRKPCCLQTDRWTDRLKDKVNLVYPPSSLFGGDTMSCNAGFLNIQRLVPFSASCIHFLIRLQLAWAEYWSVLIE